MTATPQSIFDVPGDLRDYVRLSDPETSFEAAAKAEGRAPRDRDRALAILRAHPEGLSDFELGALMGRQQTSAGKRRLELQRAGLVEDAGFTRPAPSGSPAKVWRAVPR